jgi:hypothetical protein
VQVLNEPVRSNGAARAEAKHPATPPKSASKGHPPAPEAEFEVEEEPKDEDEEEVVVKRRPKPKEERARGESSRAKRKKPETEDEESQEPGTFVTVLVYGMLGMHQDLKSNARM